MSLTDFRCAEYRDGKAVADQETRRRITEIGIRKLARAIGLNRETVAFVANGLPVKAITLQRVIKGVSKKANTGPGSACPVR